MDGGFLFVCVYGGIDCVMPGPKGSRQDAKISPCSLLLRCRMGLLLKGSHFFSSPAKICETGFIFRDPITRHCEIIRAWLNLLSSQTNDPYNHSWRDKKLNPAQTNKAALLAFSLIWKRDGSCPWCRIWGKYTARKNDKIAKAKPLFL